MKEIHSIENDTKIRMVEIGSRLAKAVVARSHVAACGRTGMRGRGRTGLGMCTARPVRYPSHDPCIVRGPAVHEDLHGPCRHFFSVSRDPP